MDLSHAGDEPWLELVTVTEQHVRREGLTLPTTADVRQQLTPLATTGSGARLAGEVDRVRVRAMPSDPQWRATGGNHRAVEACLWQAEIPGAFSNEDRFHEPVAWSGGSRRQEDRRDGPFRIGELQHETRPQLVPRASRHHAPIQAAARLCQGQKPG